MNVQYMTVFYLYIVIIFVTKLTNVDFDLLYEMGHLIHRLNFTAEQREIT